MPDLPLILATVLILATLGGSAVLWMMRIMKPKHQIIPDPGIHAWSIGWVNFLIFICALIFGITFTQVAGSIVFREQIKAADGELTPWLGVLAVLLLQAPMFAVYILLRRFAPGQFADRLNKNEISLWQAACIAVPAFIRGLPIIWLCSMPWSYLLEIFQQAGWIKEPEPQALVTLLASGGNPFAILLLVFCAVIVAPVVEETVFRGCIYRFFKSQTTLIPAQVISAVIFSCLHLNLLSFFPLVIVGFLLSRAYEAGGNLKTSIIFHACFNSFTLVILYLTSISEVIPKL